MQVENNKDQIDCYQNVGTRLTMNLKVGTRIVFSPVKKWCHIEVYGLCKINAGKSIL